MNIIDLIFPKKCLQCGKSGVYICPECLEKVGSPKLFCLECLKASIDGATHIKCRRPSSIDFAYSPFRYEGVIRSAILRLKYSFASDIKEELSKVFCERLKSEVFVLPKRAAITSIPLHRLRQNWRGFNQSQELAQAVAEAFAWEYYPDILNRKKLSKPQVELKRRQRKENIRGVFSLNNKYKSPVMRQKSLIIFDDVLTTGSTIREACKVLKRAGADTVWGLTIAA
jgi:competence protein ComFC